MYFISFPCQIILNFWVHHFLFSHSLLGEYLGCFYFLLSWVVLLLLLFFCGAGIEPRVLLMIAKCTTIELHLQHFLWWIMLLWMLLNILVWMDVFISLWYISRSRIHESSMTLYVTFWGIFKLFSTMAAPFFLFLTVLCEGVDFPISPPVLVISFLVVDTCKL